MPAESLSMPRDPRGWRWDIQQAAKRIFKFLEAKALQLYLLNDLVRSAVERQFEIMGEALVQMAKYSAPWQSAG